MAKYDITYSCGHEATVQLFGPHKDRDRKIEWMERSALCPDCYQEHLAELRRQENEAAAKAQAEVGLVPLAGTEKQVAWATTIRQGIYNRVAQLFKDPATKEQKLQFVSRMFNTEPSSRFWIDHRDDTYNGIFRALMEAHADEMSAIYAEAKAAEEGGK